MDFITIAKQRMSVRDYKETKLSLIHIYNLSYQANSACKEAIEQTISAHYAENRLDTEAAVKDVLEKFGDVYKRQILILPFVHGTAISRVNTPLSAI